MADCVNNINNLDINEDPTVRWHHCLEDSRTNAERKLCHAGRAICALDITTKNRGKCTDNPHEKLDAQFKVRMETKQKKEKQEKEIRPPQPFQMNADIPKTNRSEIHSGGYKAHHMNAEKKTPAPRCHMPAIAASLAFRLPTTAKAIKGLTAYEICMSSQHQL